MEELENNNELNNNNEVNDNVSTKNRFTAFMLCWFLGFFGVHRMYAGKVVTGILMLYGTIASVAISFVSLPAGLAGLTVVGAAVVYDFIILALKKFTDCYGKEMTSDKVN
jgi:TM2 domain-containing membrane protein YozV